MASNLPTPETTDQKFMAKAAGMSVETPTPITPEQRYLQAIAEGGGSGDSYSKEETDALLDGKADLENGKVPASQLPLATQETEGAMSSDDKLKLDGIQTDPSVVIIEDALNPNSENAVQNKTLYDKFLTIDANIAAIRVMMNAVLYGYRVNKNDSNPETRVSYMYDAVGMTPARMNYTTGAFDHGSWANAWFITGNKPVALKFDGTVDYELDPDDYTKKADGTESDVSDSAYEGNFMASMPTVWFKRWEDDDYEYVAISNKQIAPDFYADAHDNGEGDINDVIYLPMFKGVTIDGKLRSIAGAAVEGNTSGSEEKARAEANGTGWQLWDWAKHELISDLLTLISRTSNSQAAFGQGDTNTYVNDASQNYGKLNTGQHKVDGEWVMYGGGQFWGASDDKHHVKVFHIEDFWGNRWDRCLGLNLVNMEYVYKMVRPYSLDTDSTYTHSGLTAPATGYQKTQYAGRFGTLPKAIGGSQTTYVCDYFWSSSGTRLGMLGGGCSYVAYCGSRFLVLGYASGDLSWRIGGSPCFNAPHVSE